MGIKHLKKMQNEFIEKNSKNFGILERNEMI